MSRMGDILEAHLDVYKYELLELLQGIAESSKTLADTNEGRVAHIRILDLIGRIRKV